MSAEVVDDEDLDHDRVRILGVAGDAFSISRSARSSRAFGIDQQGSYGPSRSIMAIRSIDGIASAASSGAGLSSLAGTVSTSETLSTRNPACRPSIVTTTIRRRPAVLLAGDGKALALINDRHRLAPQIHEASDEPRRAWNARQVVRTTHDLVYGSNRQTVKLLAELKDDELFGILHLRLRHWSFEVP